MTDDPTQAYQPYPHDPAGGRSDESPVGWQRSGRPMGPASGGVTPGASPAPPPPVAPAPRPAAPPGYQPPPGYQAPPPAAAPAPPAHRPPPAPPAYRPAPAPARPARPAKVRRPRRRGRLVRRLIIAFLAFIVLLVGGLFAFGWWEFNKIDRVDVASVLSPQTGPGTNYLVVGTDSRDGIAAGDSNAGAFLGPGEPGGSTRTDSIMILRVEGSTSSLLSIPRDLFVTNPKTNQKSRINAVFQSGPATLIKAVQNLGIPVHHYAEINFVSFGKLVDAVGGIDIDFPFPTRDRNSGLKIDTPGVHKLDGVQGLAYVRSRHYEELKNGKWVEDPLSDLTRVIHQRAFLSALLHKVTESKNPITLAGVASAFGGGLKLDNKLGYFEALGLVWKLRGFNPTGNTIPTTPRTVNGAAVLDLAPDAPTVLAQYK